MVYNAFFQFLSILLKIFASIFIMDIGLQFCFVWCLLCGFDIRVWNYFLCFSVLKDFEEVWC